MRLMLEVSLHSNHCEVFFPHPFKNYCDSMVAVSSDSQVVARLYRHWDHLYQDFHPHSYCCLFLVGILQNFDRFVVASLFSLSCHFNQVSLSDWAAV